MKRTVATLVVTGLCTAYIVWKIDLGTTLHVLATGDSLDDALDAGDEAASRIRFVTGRVEAVA